MRSVVPPGVDGSPHTTTILSPALAIPVARASVFAALNISRVVESLFTLCGYKPQSRESLFITGSLWVKAIIGTDDLNFDTL
jgi:hypothetical protein